MMKAVNHAYISIVHDNFKNINDTYGHEVGDEILLKLCHRIENILDGRHTFERFGGDEFILIFKTITKDALTECMENIRSKV